MKNLAIAGAVIAALALLLYLSQSTDDSSIAPQAEPVSQPSVSRSDLLHASDVVAAAKAAVQQRQPELLAAAMDKVVTVAEQIGLPDADLAYLRSHQARDYVVFHAKRTVFDEAVIARYEALLPIDDLKAKYPEAEDRFADADKMILQRDVLFSALINTLKNEGMSPQQAEQQARALWREKMQQQHQPQGES